MCTAVTYKTERFYFGRNLDYDFSYGESVVIMPRGFSFPFCAEPISERRYAIIGMAHVKDGCPLFYDAMNEKGLCAAGLNFVGNAVYMPARAGNFGVAQFEVIPWLLSGCASVLEARSVLERTNVTAAGFGGLAPAELHWLIADKDGCITVEPLEGGLKIYDNPVGVLTNNPPFKTQLFSLNNYMALSPRPPKNNFSNRLKLDKYSRGMGAIGLPGDLSSQSRFVRAAFTKMNSYAAVGEDKSVSQLFHILGSAEQQCGCCITESGKAEKTIYSSCLSAQTGVYYYKTYENSQITAIDMRRENLGASDLIAYFVDNKQRIFNRN